MNFQDMVRQLMAMQQDPADEAEAPQWLQRQQGIPLRQRMQQPGYNPIMGARPQMANAQMPREQWKPGALWQGALPGRAKFI
jgi:hypothetical protein